MLKNLIKETLVYVNKMQDINSTFDKKKNSEKDISINNSKIVKRTLMSLIYVATTKTSDDYAWSAIKRLLKELKQNYGFLDLIQIKDLKSIRYTIEDIKINTNFDNIEPNELGKAIQDIIDLLKENLGSKAGYFFIQEFKNILGEEYYNNLKKIGVDLRLVDLKKELHGFSKDEYKIKDEKNSNIAFLKKIDQD